MTVDGILHKRPCSLALDDAVHKSLGGVQVTFGGNTPQFAGDETKTPIASTNEQHRASERAASRNAKQATPHHRIESNNQPTMLSNTAARTVSRMGARRTMSDSAGPKMHKAKDAWKTINATRPVDPHPHVSCLCGRCM